MVTATFQVGSYGGGARQGGGILEIAARASERGVGLGWRVAATAGVAARRRPQPTLVAARLGATGAKAEAEATQSARVRAAVFMVWWKRNNNRK